MNGKTLPDPNRFPAKYHELLAWYRGLHADRPEELPETDPILALCGLGKELWRDLSGGEKFIRELRVADIRERMLERKDRLCTSNLTLGELFAAPFAATSRKWRPTRSALSPPHVDLISFTEETAELYGRIRPDRSIAPADAIQLACAAQARVDLFLTNDRRLARKSVPGIHFIADLSFDYL